MVYEEKSKTKLYKFKIRIKRNNINPMNHGHVHYALAY